MLTLDVKLEASGSSPWQSCLARLQQHIGPSTFETWFRTTDLLVLSEGRACVQVPNQFFADFMEEHFGQLVRQLLQEQGIGTTEVCFVPTERDWKLIEPISECIASSRERERRHTVEKRGRFHPNYTFDSFVVGDSNRMAQAACQAVAEAPGKTTFNPLVMYGGTGLGKTHLLQAIGHFAQAEETAGCVLYLTSEDFTRQYIDFVIHRRDSTGFYRRFDEVDLLLLDDIHFFSGKPGTQREFYRIFNRLMRENKQIVLSSDRPPDRIPDMMEQIINRFVGGLISDIQPPNLETRMAILQKKAESDGIALPDEVCAFLAVNITSNVRELEGLLIKLIASSSFTGRDITLDVAREICGDLARRREEPLSVRAIQERVAEAWGVTPNQLAAHSRRHDVTLPRAVAMYLCKRLTKQSLRSIGLEFGNRDYSTVIHGAKRIEVDIQTDEPLRKKVEQLERVIRASA